MRFYLNRGGAAEGPLEEAAIVSMITSGQLAQGYICVEGGQAWEALDSHPAFASALAGGQQGYAAQPAQPQQGYAPQPQQAYTPQPQQAYTPQPQQAYTPQPQAQQAYTPQPQAQQAFAPQPQQQAYAAQPDYGAQAHQAAHQVAGGIEQAFNTSGAGAVVVAPSAAAPGQGYFEKAMAANEPIPESAKAAAGQAHLFAAAGALLTCATWGGPAGAFIANVLYKEQPKHPFAQYHINQALAFQGTVFVAMVALGVVFGVLGFVAAMISSLLGMILNVLYLVNLGLFFGAIVLSFIQSGKAKNGEWSQYPVIGKKIMGLAKPIIA